MAKAAWNPARAKVQLKLAVQRTKMLQEKMEAMQKADRREVATLIERSKLETARVKTEGLINNDIHIELIELMELYSETLLARFALLELGGTDPDPSIIEPLSSIIYAAPRTELRELHTLREILMVRYGKEFSEKILEEPQEGEESPVSPRVRSKLKVGTPSKELVDMYISEICKTYNVPFSSPYLQEDKPEPLQTTEDAQGTVAEIAEAADGPSEKGAADSSQAASNTNETKPATEESALDSLEARFAALKKR